ncbi:MAG TPA: universal stress protein [Dehalococcoidia bacterium]|nr:universal stress protein [Dehalococcoidia bacterium]
MASIVVFVDRWEGTEEAFLWLDYLVSQLGGRLVLVDAVTQDACLAGSRGHRDPAQMEASAYAHMASVCQRLKREVHLQALHGAMVETLPIAAVANEAELVVLLEPEGREASRWMFRAEALKTTLRCQCPVLLLTTGYAPHGRGLILLPHDGSEAAAVTFPVAQRLASALGWGIVLLQVLPLEADDWQGDPEIEELVRRWQAVAHERLTLAAEELRRSGVEVRVETALGSPAQAILRVAHALDADLIVLATHGRSRGAGHRLGATAEAVFMRSPLPCLLVPSGAEGHGA